MRMKNASSPLPRNIASVNGGLKWSTQPRRSPNPIYMINNGRPSKTRRFYIKQKGFGHMDGPR